MRNFTLLIVLTFGLVACHGNDDNVVVTPTPTPTPDPIPTPDPVPNQLKSLAAQNANDEAGAIGNATDLIDDINALFRGLEPVEVEESLVDVIDKTEG